MHIIKKKKKYGKPQYYLVKTARVNGKPRIVWQKYLGTAESLLKKLESKEEVNVHSKVFGSVACMLSISDELNFKEIINSTITDNNYKLSVWQHILMQSICRFNKPLSKKQSLRWYDKSILPLLWKKRFSSPQTILNQFDKLVNATQNKIPQIEEKLCRNLFEKGIKPSVLIWDPTNFFTYIEKGEKLPKKGSSKEKRYDKNIINLGFVVSQENIPLMHTVYEGNKKESKVVTEIVDGIYARIKKIAGSETLNVDELVFVFDKGNNSKDNISYIDGKFNFIGSLSKTQLKHLYDIPLSEFHELYTNKKGHVIKGYKTKENVYNEKYTIVVTYNEKTKKRQEKTTLKAISKIKSEFKKLEKINHKKKGRKCTLKGVSQRINQFLHKQYQSLFTWSFDEKKQKISWSYNESVFKQKSKKFGKSVLFSDLHDWTNEKIAKTYNSKSIIEGDFKILKNKLLIPIKPFNHRLDHRLRAHIFVCLVAMIFYRYMIWKLACLNMSEKQIVSELRNMRVAFIKKSNSRKIKTVLENMSPNQIKLFSILNLDNYLPI